jgi:hypothetical protein
MSAHIIDYPGATAIVTNRKSTLYVGPAIDIMPVGTTFRVRDYGTGRLVPPVGIDPFTVIVHGTNRQSRTVWFTVPALPCEMLPYSVMTGSELKYAESYEMYTDDDDMERVVIETDDVQLGD